MDECFYENHIELSESALELKARAWERGATD